MSDFRIQQHPILPSPSEASVPFTWKGQPMTARPGEVIASALFANGVRVFGHHHKDGSPQGIFCANGQCAQCSVIADGLSVKSCMVPVKAGMQVEPLEGRATLPEAAGALEYHEVETVETEVLILGGGPAGLSAAIELAKAGVGVILVDDKAALGGKLVLQTHKFFGSIDACHAGTRGMDIGQKLEAQVRSFENVRIWNETTAISVFSDRKVGVLRQGHYVLVRPQMLLVATGAREKSLVFKGNTLPGVYGAGAFQTLVNRDLVRPTERLFVIGGGNVGLIAAYHALQAGIQVVGLCEALEECGGYKVHKDKLVRMGVPIHTRHTVVCANGAEEVESVTIAQLDDRWKIIPDTEKTFQCDTVLVAVGLEPVDEFLAKAKEFGLPVFAAGDAEEIAEASAAMFTGKIRGLEIAKALGRDVGDVPPEWHRTAEVLKSRPGATITEEIPEDERGVFPVFHCSQEIPCNPCTSICPKGAIQIEGNDILGLPMFNEEDCIACEQCVAVCPGLAITLVDFRKVGETDAIVSIPYEFPGSRIKEGDVVTVLDTLGHELGNVPVVKVRSPKFADHALLVKVKAPPEIAKLIAGIRVQEPWVTEPAGDADERMNDDEIVCRCERVTAGEIRALIRKGVRDMNQLKAATRAGMGACGGKTCPSLIKRIFREEGVPESQITDFTKRPVFIEVPLGAFAGVVTGEGPAVDAAPIHAVSASQGGL
jgi:thioredoxin reductase/Fe-S-cluster-containing hydrogenase component 2/bacterioferritin-associated ferredoxin